MDTLYRVVAGLDVHKKTVVACVRRTTPEGRVAEETRTYRTMTRDLLAMSDWMTRRGVTHVAMESTGVFWKPVWNILEGMFELMLVNPRELKQVPGRKSDVRDCQWIAQLLACGLLRSSLVPDRIQRDLRDLTRLRAQLVGEHTRIDNRIQKVLEEANIKLGSVASKALSKSGRAMIQAMIDGEQDGWKLAHLALGRLRAKIEELGPALEGRVTEHHRFLLKLLMGHLLDIERRIAELEGRIDEQFSELLPPEDQRRLDQVPGLDRRTIQDIVVEIGACMDPFPTEEHVSSWAGVCPGNEASAGKRIRSRTTKGNRWLRRALSEAAWAAAHTKDTYLAAQYRRLAARRGKKRAVVAVAHSILVIVYHLLKDPTKTYHELGGDYFDKREPERLKRYLVRRLQSLGYTVTLESDQHAAA